MRALLVCNDGDSDPGFVGARLEHHGFTIERWHREEHRGWPELDRADLVFLLGSEWSVYWEHVAEPVEQEAALVRAAVERGVPVLGICFGAQLVAHALGGPASVRRSEVPEVGWYEIESDLPDVIAPGPWLQWHYDVLTVPPGAEELARSAVGPQAYRIGRTLAVQFHPEVDAGIVGRWAGGEAGEAELRRLGLERAELLARTARETVRSRGESDTLVDWYLATVAAAPLGPPPP